MQCVPRLLIALGELLSCLEYAHPACITLLSNLFHDFEQVVLGIWVLSISTVGTQGLIALCQVVTL